jgi:branched-subunit amino acid transport protein
MSIWLIMLLGGLLTFAMRYSFIYLLGRLPVPDFVRRALRFVPPAVLSALITPALLMPAGRFGLGPDNQRWLAGLVAILVAWRTKSMLISILAGIAALIILQLLPFI